jgi:hypothetical protein
VRHVPVRDVQAWVPGPLPCRGTAVHHPSLAGEGTRWSCVGPWPVAKSLRLHTATWVFVAVLGSAAHHLPCATVPVLPCVQREVDAWTDMNVVVYHGSALARQCIREHEFHFSSGETGARVPPRRGVTAPYKFHVRMLGCHCAVQVSRAYAGVSLRRTSFPCVCWGVTAPYKFPVRMLGCHCAVQASRACNGRVVLAAVLLPPLLAAAVLFFFFSCCSLGVLLLCNLMTFQRTPRAAAGLVAALPSITSNPPSVRTHPSIKPLAAPAPPAPGAGDNL